MIMANEISKTPHQQGKFEEKFGRDVSDLMSPKNPSGTVMTNFAGSIARRFRLYNHEAKDLIALAVEQGLAYSKKREIKDPVAWLRTAIFRIAQNLVRKNVSQENLVSMLGSEISMICHDQTPIAKLEFEEMRNLLIESRKFLRKDDQEILALYLDDGKSFEEIRDYYGQKNYTLGAIRQKICRAKQRLSEKFRRLIADPVSVQEVKKNPRYAPVKATSEPKIFRY